MWVEVSNGTSQLITGEYTDDGTMLCIIVKMTTCVSIYLKFLYRVIICFHISMLLNYMKCCDYLVPIQHNVYFF